jgi:hypothetical protein
METVSKKYQLKSISFLKKTAKVLNLDFRVRSYRSKVKVHIDRFIFVPETQEYQLRFNKWVNGVGYVQLANIFLDERDEENRKKAKVVEYYEKKAK